ncbi:MAG: SgcJ/EcaC family oxidoreductase [Burkholderiaceae bacterium]
MATKSEQVVDGLVDAYNKQDARRFADLFSMDATLGDFLSNDQLKGREAIFQRFQQMFDEYPENTTRVLNRTVIGRFVIDHEHVSRSKQGESFQVMAINEIVDGLVKSLTVVR